MVYNRIYTKCLYGIFLYAAPMNVTIIGTGYVGLVSGACFAKLGNNVTCVDIDKEKINKINNSISPIHEKGLEKILKDNKERIKATSSYEKAMQQSDITFICVGTPSKENGEIDLSYIKNATIEVAKQIKKINNYHIVIMKSTVIPGTTEKIVLPLLEQYSNKKAGIDFGVGMNPEFLKEGEAVNDFLNPDRVVNGHYDEKTKKILKELYKNFSCPIIETTLTTAEMIKYASNCFLAAKISFINEIGNMCKKLKINTYDVSEGMGMDKRIGPHFLNSGIGWGGSCFPKDTNALMTWAKQNNIDYSMIKSTIEVNDKQPLELIKILKKHIPNLNDKTIGILGLAFKPDTDDIRDSRSIPLVEKLINEGAKIKVYDPKAMDNFKQLFPDITYCKSAEEILKSDAILIATIWNQFNDLNFKNNIVIDGRKLKNAQKTAKIYEGVCW